MDASKRLQMRAEAMQNYRSNWQGRSASEVTMRHRDMSNKNNKSTHNGPVEGCCSDGVPPPRPTSPTRGFSTTYENAPVFLKKAGCAECNDPNFGEPGGVIIQPCQGTATVATVQSQILGASQLDGSVYPAPLNPVKGTKCCASPGIFQRPGLVDCSTVPPSYSGWRNQTSYLTNGAPHTSVGTVRQSQVPPYPSG